MQVYRHLVYQYWSYREVVELYGSPSSHSGEIYGVPQWGAERCYGAYYLLLLMACLELIAPLFARLCADVLKRYRKPIRAALKARV